ncbi:MAG: hypothetical protein KDD70_15230 [Bdellovibrionales bacterium]|nr:hypothetical protein [Bdellovibrionales bacterium]
MSAYAELGRFQDEQSGFTCVFESGDSTYLVTANSKTVATTKQFRKLKRAINRRRNQTLDRLRELEREIPQPVKRIRKLRALRVILRFRRQFLRRCESRDLSILGDIGTPTPTSTPDPSPTLTPTSTTTPTPSPPPQICEPNTTEFCGSIVGACFPGERTCSNDGANWSACTDISPVEEVCGDNSDNDCDSLVDEDCPAQVTPALNARSVGNFYDPAGQSFHGVDTFSYFDSSRSGASAFRDFAVVSTQQGVCLIELPHLDGFLTRLSDEKTERCFFDERRTQIPAAVGSPWGDVAVITSKDNRRFIIGSNQGLGALEVIEVTDPDAPYYYGARLQTGGFQGIHRIVFDSANMRILAAGARGYNGNDWPALIVDVSDPLNMSISQILSGRGAGVPGTPYQAQVLFEVNSWTKNNAPGEESYLLHAFHNVYETEPGEFSFDDYFRVSSYQELASVNSVTPIADRYRGANGVPHSQEVSRDGKLLISSSETVDTVEVGAAVSIYDFEFMRSNPGAEPVRLSILENYGSNRGTHFAHIYNRTLLTANFTNGVSLHDLSDPSHPQIVAFFDTSVVPGDGRAVAYGSSGISVFGVYHGSWDAALAESGLVIASDTDQGLEFILAEGLLLHYGSAVQRADNSFPILEQRDGAGLLAKSSQVITADGFDPGQSVTLLISHSASVPTIFEGQGFSVDVSQPAAQTLNGVADSSGAARFEIPTSFASSTGELYLQAFQYSESKGGFIVSRAGRLKLVSP